MPLWLEISKKLHAIAESGLFFTTNFYERERYEQIKELSNELISHYSNTNPEKVKSFYDVDDGYVTPKVDIRSVVISNEGVLFVKEKADSKWTFPGGYADIGFSPFEVAVKETFEEAGLEVKAVRLLAVMDKKMHPHPPSPFYMYKMFILCEIKGGTLSPGSETLDAKFFPLHTIPELSEPRLTQDQYNLILKLYFNSDLQTYCE
jgi:ADP-ribose pyrophosphatase YjhB (NUDIX family)